jgi:hypothetical protein
VGEGQFSGQGSVTKGARGRQLGAKELVLGAGRCTWASRGWARPSPSPIIDDGIPNPTPALSFPPPDLPTCLARYSELRSRVK